MKNMAVKNRFPCTIKVKIHDTTIFIILSQIRKFEALGMKSKFLVHAMRGSNVSLSIRRFREKLEESSIKIK